MKLIDVEELLENLSKAEEAETASPLKNPVDVVRYIKHWIERAEAADVQEVVHAHWISYQRGDPGECSNCGLNWDENMKNNGEDWGEWDPVPAYCPNCGAKMEGEE